MTLVIPASPPPVPPLDADPAGTASIGPGRRSTGRVEEVGGWAESYGVPEGWVGDASAAASHALTRLAGDPDVPGAAVRRGVAALDVYYDAVAGLARRRDDLVEERRSLATRQSALAEAGASYLPEEEVGLALRARSLELDLVSWLGRVESWADDLRRAETTVLAALRGSDTAAEVRRHLAVLASDVRSLVADLVDDGVLAPQTLSMGPDRLRRWLVEHPEAAAALMARRPAASHGSLAAGLAAVLPGSGAGPEQARRFFDALPPRAAATLAMLYPGSVGGLRGAPFERRADANTVAVAVALADERARVADRSVAPGDRLARHDELQRARDRIELYTSILDGERRLIAFDPRGDGTVVELHGDLGPDLDDVGVLVPGAETDLESFARTAGRADGFADAAPDELAMVSWLGGDMPDLTVPLAADPAYAQALGPELAEFSRDLRSELEHSPAAAGEMRTSYVGHSYGGAVVGLGEVHGLDADRVLHVSSAGNGHDVWSPSDLPPSQSGVDRYSMTAPGDFIEDTQGRQLAGLGHGADPDDFGDTLRLHTGNDEHGEPIAGWGGHSGVLDPQGDAWPSVLGVLTGGVVDSYREPLQHPWETSPHGWGPGKKVDVE